MFCSWFILHPISILKKIQTYFYLPKIYCWCKKKSHHLIYVKTMKGNKLYVKQYMRPQRIIDRLIIMRWFYGFNQSVPWCEFIHMRALGMIESRDLLYHVKKKKKSLIYLWNVHKISRQLTENNVHCTQITMRLST